MKDLASGTGRTTKIKGGGVAGQGTAAPPAEAGQHHRWDEQHDLVRRGGGAAPALAGSVVRLLGLHV